MSSTRLTALLNTIPSREPSEWLGCTREGVYLPSKLCLPGGLLPYEARRIEPHEVISESVHEVGKDKD